MSQIDFIKSHLEKYGEISRNTALANHITRLGAYICILNKIYDIEGEWRGKDYVYRWKGFVKPRQEVWLVKDDYGNVVDSIRKEITMKM